jgi:hypothetical protein
LFVAAIVVAAIHLQPRPVPARGSVILHGMINQDGIENRRSPFDSSSPTLPDRSLTSSRIAFIRWSLCAPAPDLLLFAKHLFVEAMARAGRGGADHARGRMTVSMLCAGTTPAPPLVLGVAIAPAQAQVA